ncbi:type II secretory ATPase GspE/PulE/Tfp pilus assembly ATPase PilB-like protein [Ereboglobus sp. PH5-5]|uniref:GspE/PulE family protein n=1 Tax=Ereboglobus sp. PH5-5 TaxID=2940529 RepID=UPI002404E471|nr:GspE/PulE family protein [Ereboglobus sp. PH5-5]MDF9833687.1 type II secretory ATPase GspE/PulE/Tfp pilus assembly ATPase PilB-like protein [Ereboglobus sp. PH5-5]
MSTLLSKKTPAPGLSKLDNGAAAGGVAPGGKPQSRFESDFLWMPQALRDKGVGASSIKIATDYYNQQGRRSSFGSVLVELGILTPFNLTKLISEHHKLPVITLSSMRISMEVARLLSPTIARRLRVLPLKRNGSMISLAVSDPSIPGFAEATQALGRYGITVFEYNIAPEAEVLAKLEELYASRADVSDPGRFFDLLVTDAVNMGVSDIHVVPEEVLTQIKFRVDGAMQPYKVIDSAVRESVAARIKMKGGLDIAVKHIPQDGRAKLVLAGKKINLRFSSLPTLYGESVVIRILDQSKGIVPLEKLGMLDDTKAAILGAANAPFGFTYFVGPTGSGKTTSLYSIINTLDVTNYTMMTLEDPVEYEFRNIRQTEVTESLTFALGLRSLLRQDPDYILVGETRDKETAELSMRAALTGHTGFSTLHANTALGGITRLIDIGVEPSIIIGAVNLFVSQRLIRRLCVCKEPHPQSASLAEIHGIKLQEGETLYRPKPGGCNVCNGSGYKGRVGLYECRPVEPFADIIVRQGKDALRECEAHARKLCATETEQTGSSIFRTLRQDGFLKAVQGQTSIEEVIAQTESEDSE